MSDAPSDEASVTSGFNRVEEYLGGLFIIGSWKYVILILGEVLVFHLLRRTIEILSGKEEDASFTAFLAAQKRMIAIAFFSWISEMVLTILIGVALSIIGFSFLKPVLVFLVSSYFLGFALTDNYFERVGLSIKESQRLNMQIIGVSLGLGAILYVLFLIPIVGPIFGTAVGAVAAAMTLYKLEQQGDLVIETPKTVEV